MSAEKVDYGIWVSWITTRLSMDLPLITVGSILVDGIAILVTAFLLWRSQRKKAAVGRRYGTKACDEDI